MSFSRTAKTLYKSIMTSLSLVIAYRKTSNMMYNYFDSLKRHYELVNNYYKNFTIESSGNENVYEQRIYSFELYRHYSKLSRFQEYSINVKKTLIIIHLHIIIRYAT